VINPAEDVLRFIGGDDDEGFVYPLRQGGNRLQVRPRRHHHDHPSERQADPAPGPPDHSPALRLAADVGTLWYDAETLGLVQAVFKPARPFELQRDLSARQGGRAEVGERDRGGQVRHPGIRPLRIALVDAALHGARCLGLDGLVAQRADPLRAGLRRYEVEGGTPPDPNTTFIPAGTFRRYSDRTARTTITIPSRA
jgi:hypothetical protein